MSELYKVIQLNEDTWCFEEQGGVRFFLLTGTKKALLIDSGMMINNAKEIAQEITDLPLELLNTHADRDHIGSNAEFEAAYMSLAEASNYHNTQKAAGEIIPVWDGDVLDLGERKLEIIAVPGHTPGSIAVLDQKYKALFSGDPIQDGNIFMFGVQRDFCAYRHSLMRLKEKSELFTTIYPSHGTLPIEKEMIDSLITAAEEIMAGNVQGVEAEFHGIPLIVYKAGGAKFLGER